VVKTLGLNGTWELQQAGQRARVPAQVPGDVYNALLRARKIPDPYYRDNENRLQWIGESDWTFARRFRVPAGLAGHDRVLLRCEGLDTLATVIINGKKVASTDNMFRTWEWDVKRLLRPGDNRIEVRFRSVMPYVCKKQKEHFLRYWNDACGAGPFPWVRKQACNFGWDWGIKAVTAGIWRPIRLVAFDTARLSDVHILQEHGAGRVDLAVKVEAEVVTKANLAASVTVSYKGKVVGQDLVRLRRGRGTAQIAVRDPQLWWPNNLGGQPLYDVKVDLVDDAASVLDSQSKRIGLRTLRLDRHKDQWGESFQFVINGIPFFAKGANWIPDDGILSRMTPERYRRRVQDAADANMNMLRVWGGGIYEDDAFYDACDELGITVWQDFMFACASYPCGDPAFRANVEAEARDNVRRLRHHPSIALWCGNNEIENALGSGDKRFEASMSWKDYSKVFDVLLGKVVAAVDPQRDYWPSSPHSPYGERKDYNNRKWGDAHLWGVWHGGQPFEWYRTCEHRFNSEFGFQSFPEPKTVYAYTAPQDRNITSAVMEHHQRSGIGNTTIMRYMLDWFRLPCTFESTLWASQILQGMAMKYAVEHWRRSMPRGMGTLYWQLNDTWPVASWSSIDYHGRWKALQYMARKFFAPLLVSGVEDAAAGTVTVFVTSDLLENVSARLRWRVCSVAGKTLRTGGKVIRAAKQASRKIETLDVSDLLGKYGPAGLLVHLELAARGEPVSTNLVTFSRPKHMELSTKPGIKAAVQPVGQERFAVTLTAKQPALWTWLELSEEDATLSDNFVHLLPGQTAKILVRPKRPMKLGEFREQLIVRSLVDTYT